ncbi:fumarylacetoacetate hydrolase family protein [Kineosporia sp. NBRC 101731]|uniref:fumarylacetoacetate hydrolase family protein n=1 Tax=Kineosporia sp. NBRC 101731 TaxID=3032199 RepID=UPI0024A4E57F|nr:fumarylacetoacetate hydrolase family protein [Kineosporia sp. NBRC 101731]GLY33950.1 2-hydroxyhepta-2,4-diene-1,7-dioate isomerase [Kineosporia sp. NBRC 101731]
MKLIRVGEPGAECVGALGDDGTRYDLSHVLNPYQAWTFGDLERARTTLEHGAAPALPGPDLRLGSPIPRPGAIVCVGLNYRDHASETGADEPAEPVLFLKLPSTVIGPNDPVLVPPGSRKTDYEVELGIVLGKQVRYLDSAEDGLSAIAGYLISHDVTERAYQLERGGQWDKGKNCETFNPMGPWFVTSDEVPCPDSLALRLWVNGELRQSASTGDMIFGVGELVRYISQFMVLEAGDVINTGTPAGVALGSGDSRKYLRAGDVIEIEIDQLGRMSHLMREARVR